ncbi:AbrB/MazE/SpoVT family DNA-binding domain-containing protein [Acidianus manzaensis]|uniref:AbrB family transcriptional regulator n=1 Tax=Acidianus manzaensis TaxID=282676 RepID=A0A1W6JWP6_9CREN|nr:AbrB/MazE/SpoVT family DNA-binding domain-containing protein [Acidianus manzaensis]ARM74711.1 AbrB family transcriptional regulator [Acidianus manzaensis]
MTIRIEVGKEGYIIIPKKIRDLLSINEGDILILRVENNKIILEREKKIDIEDIKNKFIQHEKRLSYIRKPKLGELAEVKIEDEFKN